MAEDRAAAFLRRADGELAEDHEADLNRLAPPTRFAGLIETSDPDQMPGQYQIPHNPNPNDNDKKDTNRP